MADAPTVNKKGLPALSEAAQAAADVLTKVAAAIPGEDGGKEPESPITNEALEQLRWARKKYDSVVRWILGCFAAIGLIIFGSLPFVELTNVSSLLVLLGLGAAALGLGVIVWAASRAFEPENASLGELDELLQRVDSWKKKKPNHPWRERWRPHWRPRWKTACELHEIINLEPQTHIGPGMDSVRDLIVEIGDVEQRILTLRSGNVSSATLEHVNARIDEVRGRPFHDAPENENPDAKTRALQDDERATKSKLRGVLNAAYGVGASEAELWADVPAIEVGPEALATAASRQAASVESRNSLVARARQVAIALQRLPILRSGRRGDLVENDLAESRRLLDELGVHVGLLPDELPKGTEYHDPKPLLTPRVDGAKAVLPKASSLPDSAALMQAEARLKIRGEARDLLLAESGLAQLRGTFRVVRAMLLAGATLVLFGGATYAWALANPPITGLNTPVVVTLYTDDAKESIPALPTNCIVDETQNWSAKARLLTAEHPDDPNRGAFSVLLLDEQCLGERADIAMAQGLVALDFLKSESSDSGAQDGPAAPAEGPLIQATIVAGSDAWRAARADCDVPVGVDLTVTAILRSTAEDDGRADGPFAITIVDNTVCPSTTIPLEIASGEGTYRPLP